MSDENTPSVPPVEDSAPETKAGSPAAAPDGEWQMPKPVFRQSSGYLPKIFNKKFLEDDTQEPKSERADRVESAEQRHVAESAAVAPVPAPEIQPQPVLSEEFTLEDIHETAPAKKPRGGALRVVLTILAILAMLAIVFVLLVAVYLLFFLQASESQNLN